MSHFGLQRSPKRGHYFMNIESDVLKKSEEIIVVTSRRPKQSSENLESNMSHGFENWKILLIITIAERL
jgi:hypothetical protein